MAVEALSKVRPTHLYIAADGPRATVPSDARLCQEARTAALNISWPCEVVTNFSAKNLGVDPAVEHAIKWFFEHETEGIILEDDCIPHPDFFPFVKTMLERYRNDERVMMISGDNFQGGQVRGDGSYYFSRYANTWGWATWKRAWDRYDTTLSLLPEFIEKGAIAAIRPSVDEQKHWQPYFKKLRGGVHSAWDAKWIFALWAHDGVALVPKVNLVVNEGFGSEATHTKNGTSPAGESHAFPPPYCVPTDSCTDEAADRYIFKTIFRVTLVDKVRHILHILHEKALPRPKTTTH